MTKSIETFVRMDVGDKTSELCVLDVRGDITVETISANRRPPIVGAAGSRGLLPA